GHLPQQRKRLLCPAGESTRAARGDDGRRLAAFGDRRGMAERGGLVGQGQGTRAAIQGDDHEDGAAAYRRSYLVVRSAADVTFNHAGRSASQPRALQDTAVRNESPLSPDRSGRAGAVPSAYLRGTGSTDKSQVHRGKIKRGSAHTVPRHNPSGAGEGGRAGSQVCFS